MSTLSLDRAISILSQLTEEEVTKVCDYAESLLTIDKELLDLKEQQAIETLGYNPTQHIDDWEWEAMLKRDQMSEDMEKNK